MADNLKDRLARAVRSKDPNNTDGPHFVDTSGTMTLTNGGGGVSQVDDTGFVPGVNSLSPIGGYQGGRSVASGHIAAPALNASGMLIVAVGAGGAGGGVAQLQVQGTEGNWFNVGYASGGDFRNVVPVSGTVNLAGGAAPFATVGVYGSPAFPVYVLGSINPHGVFAPAGSLNVIGSMGVTPLASFTVNQGSIATVNLGLGTVNIGNVVSFVGSANITPQGVQVVDVRGSLTATQWIISFGGSGQFLISGSAPANQRTYFTGYRLINTGTADLQFQSPSGVAISGSIRILPGAGLVDNGGGIWPVLIGSQQSPIFVLATGTQNIGGWANGYIAP